MSETTDPPVNGHNLSKQQVPESSAAVAGDETERSRQIRERKDAEPSQPPADGTPPAEAAPVKRVRWSLFKVDGDWPPPGVHHVDVEIPRPASFSRAYAVKDKTVGLDGRPNTKLRMVFVVCPDAPKMPVRVVIMDHDSAIGVEVGKQIPNYLDTVINPNTGEPVGLWLVSPESTEHDADGAEIVTVDV